jgi:hypothetical protein
MSSRLNSQMAPTQVTTKKNLAAKGETYKPLVHFSLKRPPPQFGPNVAQMRNPCPTLSRHSPRHADLLV